MAEDLFVDDAPLGDGSAWSRNATGRIIRLRDPADVRALEATHPAWDHVVLAGGSTATVTEARAAFRALRGLLADAGPTLAHAGVDLPGGFRSTYADARTAEGDPAPLVDRRDAVLVRLRTVGAEGADALGPRTRLLATLFGPRATKPVGVALAKAVEEGRWDAVALAVAVSDGLGPERLQEVLALPGEDPVADGPWSALTAAGWLREVLEPYPEKRRSELLRSLWDEVAGVRAAAVAADADRGRRRATLDRLGARPDDDAVRRIVLDDEERFLRQWLEVTYREPPSLADLVVLRLPNPVARRLVDQAVREVMAARLLADLALADRDGDLDEALLALQPALKLVGAADARATSALLWCDALAWIVDRATKRGKRRYRTIGSVTLDTTDLAGSTQAALGTLVPMAMVAVARFERAIWWLRRLDLPLAETEWVRPPARALVTTGWPDPRGWGVRLAFSQDDHGETLAERHARYPASMEVTADLLFVGELFHRLADLHGNDDPAVRWAGELSFTLEPAAVALEIEVDPLWPSSSSLPAALAGAAQLVRLGASHPDKPRTWSELVAGLHGSVDTESFYAGDLKVPKVMRDGDGLALAGGTLRLATTSRTLGEWGRWMGNCIATYADEGRRGSSVLFALEVEGKPTHNLELVKRMNRWRVGELRSRFNGDPEPAVERAIGTWLDSINAAEAARRAARTGSSTLMPAPRRPAKVGRHRRPEGAFADARDALAAACERVVDAAVAERAAVDAMAGLLGGDGAGALLRSDSLTPALLDPHVVWTVAMWRPVADAVAGLDPAVLQVLPDLGVLVDGGHPAPPGARRLTRVAGIGDAWLGARAGRAVSDAWGALVAAEDPLVASVLTTPHRELGLATILVRTAAGIRAPGPGTRLRVPPDGTVPGFPALALLDPATAWGSAWSVAERMHPDVAILRPAAELAFANGHPFDLSLDRAWIVRGWAAWWGAVNRRRPALSP